MSVAGRICLDTNILVYSVDLDAGERHKRAKEIIEQAFGIDCVLPLQVLAEFSRVTISKKLLEPDKAREIVLKYAGIFHLVHANTATLLDTIDAVREHRLSFWDAMIWAVARQAGCSAIISEDMQNLRNLGGVTLINPFAADAGSHLEKLFRGG